MKIIKGNIFDGEWHGLVHIVNLHHAMKSGIAKQIVAKYPEAREADNKTEKGGIFKLGNFSFAHIPLKDTDEMIDIFNLYGQVGIGNYGNPLNRNVRYDHVHDGLFRICDKIMQIKHEEKYILAMPEIGCGLAGGDRGIIHAILKFVESHYDEIEFNLYVL